MVKVLNDSANNTGSSFHVNETLFLRAENELLDLFGTKGYLYLTVNQLESIDFNKLKNQKLKNNITKSTETILKNSKKTMDFITLLVDEYIPNTKYMLTQIGYKKIGESIKETGAKRAGQQALEEIEPVENALLEQKAALEKEINTLKAEQLSTMGYICDDSEIKPLMDQLDEVNKQLNKVTYQKAIYVVTNGVDPSIFGDKPAEYYEVYKLNYELSYYQKRLDSLNKMSNDLSVEELEKQKQVIQNYIDTITLQQSVMVVEGQVKAFQFGRKEIYYYDFFYNYQKKYNFVSDIDIELHKAMQVMQEKVDPSIFGTKTRFEWEEFYISNYYDDLYKKSIIEQMQNTTDQNMLKQLQNHIDHWDIYYISMVLTDDLISDETRDKYINIFHDKALEIVNGDSIESEEYLFNIVVNFLNSHGFGEEDDFYKALFCHYEDRVNYNRVNNPNDKTWAEKFNQIQDIKTILAENNRFTDVVLEDYNIDWHIKWYGKVIDNNDYSYYLREIPGYEIEQRSVQDFFNEMVDKYIEVYETYKSSKSPIEMAEAKQKLYSLSETIIQRIAEGSVSFIFLGEEKEKTVQNILKEILDNEKNDIKERLEWDKDNEELKEQLKSFEDYLTNLYVSGIIVCSNSEEEEYYSRLYLENIERDFKDELDELSLDKENNLDAIKRLQEKLDVIEKFRNNYTEYSRYLQSKRKLREYNSIIVSESKRSPLDSETLEHLEELNCYKKIKEYEIVEFEKKYGITEENGLKAWFDSFIDSITLWRAVFDDTKPGTTWDKIQKAAKASFSNFVIMSEKALAGVLQIVEHIGDGMLFIFGSAHSLCTLIGGGDAAATLSVYVDGIRTKFVSKLEYKLFDGTDLNNNATLKYDSDGAEWIKDTSIKVFEYAAATVVTCYTCGAGAFIVGFVEGAGQAAEKYANTVNREKGEEYNFGALYLKSVAGGLDKGLEWLNNGKTGAKQIGKFSSTSKEAMAEIAKERLAIKELFESSIKGDNVKRHLWEKFINKDSVISTISTGMSCAADVLLGKMTLFDLSAKMGEKFFKNFTSSLVKALGESNPELFSRYKKKEIEDIFESGNPKMVNDVIKEYQELLEKSKNATKYITNALTSMAVYMLDVMFDDQEFQASELISKELEVLYSMSKDKLVDKFKETKSELASAVGKTIIPGKLSDCDKITTFSNKSSK